MDYSVSIRGGGGCGGRQFSKWAFFRFRSLSNFFLHWPHVSFEALCAQVYFLSLKLVQELFEVIARPPPPINAPSLSYFDPVGNSELLVIISLNQKSI